MLELKKLLDGSVKSLDFSTEPADISSFDDVIGGSVAASGRITNHSGLILLEGEIRPAFRVACARCGVEFDYTESVPFGAKLTDKLANDDEGDFVIVENALLDIDELVRETLVLELPSRYLCDEGCRGLCPKCGKNLNSGACSCDLTERDPRWAALADYFDD